jgi:transcription-repair coupling factor (superfamily II helicase)
LKRGVLVAPVATLLQRLAPRHYLDGHSLVLARATGWTWT